MKLGVLDQTPVPRGGTAEEAMRNTIELAKLTDRLGYSRYWVSEHHDTPGLAGSSPEVLLGAIGAHTSRIRIGSGGVLLPHYSPYKVAENFRVLEALYPGRVDLGIGRAPGGMPRSSFALRYGRAKPKDEQWPDVLKELADYLGDGAPEGHELEGLQATPLAASKPDVWLLGSTDFSAKVAAQLGAGFSFAHFINGDGGHGVLADYMKSYRPGPLGESPRANVCVMAVCADSDEEAERIARLIDLRLLLFEKGEFRREMPTFEEAELYPYTEYDRSRISDNRNRMLVGGPDRIEAAMRRFQADYGVEEILVTAITDSQASRLRSYELLAERFL